MVRHLTSLYDFTPEELEKIIDLGIDVKKNPEKYATALKDKTLLMIFEKPSLRTRVSFEVGMTQMGGHGIFYSIADSPMGKKESIEDTVKTSSRFVDIIMARLFEHEHIMKMAQHSDVPVINALTNFSHPCQIACDLQIIKEKKGKLKGLKLAYFGDSNNNVTHSLLYGCSMVGMDVAVASPKGIEYEPQKKVVEKAKEYASKHGSKILITNDAVEAAKNADIIYTDSWMSYHIPKEKEAERVQLFKPYQVNSVLMKHAKPDAVFMNCLPAMRGYEQTAEVIDGSQSIVFDQAENRLHIQKAIMLFLLGKMK
ncbi:MAG: ornithine carbamoyltransferase [Candidatus Diapherotrites archaeon]|nr:ornithine carbamoyltransferase [Candidatus Diapherotrites archaeon]